MKRKIPYDQPLILIVLTLVGFGLVMVFSASSFYSKEMYGSSSFIFLRQLVAVGVGLLVLVITTRVNYHILENRYLVVALLVGVSILLVWALLSPGTNGAHRWIRLGPTNFQPSELAKLAVILAASYLLVRSGGRLEQPDKRTWIFLFALGGIVLLVLIEPDLGTSTSLVLTIALMLFLGGLRFRYFMIAAALAVPVLFLLVSREAYRYDRILAFLDPAADPLGMGYQILQSLAAVGSGGLTGVGLAQGTQKLLYLPEPHSDFIFAVIGEEVGLIGCLAVLLLFGALFWRGVLISLRADTLFGMYLGLGIITMIVFQAFFNMSVVLSLCPTKGIPLPFISAGGSSMLVTLTGIGILLNISRHSQRDALAELKA